MNPSQTDLVNKQQLPATTPLTVMWWMFLCLFVFFSFTTAKPRKETNRSPWGGKSSTWTLKRSGQSFCRWITTFNWTGLESFKLYKWTKTGNWSLNVLCVFFFLLLYIGDPVSFGEWSSPEHPRGHCTVPLQRRGAQQNSHRGLLRRTVSSTVFPPFSFHLSFSSLQLLVRSAVCHMFSDVGIKSEEIGGLSLLVKAKMAVGACDNEPLFPAACLCLEIVWIAKGVPCVPPLL